METPTYLRRLLLSISGTLVLCIVFAARPELGNGIVTGKVCWFHFAMLFLAATTLLSEIITSKNRLTIVYADIIVLLFAGVTLLTYNWTLNPKPESLLFGGQLMALWFMLRVAFNSHPSLRLFFLSIIACFGLIESIIGIQQLYGAASSNHSLFRLTGSFFNPGPFSGYIAIALPISFSMLLRLSDCKKEAWWEMRTLLYYLGWVCTISIFIVLPAGMSRSAWLAAWVSCAWVYWMNRIGWKKTKEGWAQHPKRFITISLIALLLFAVGLSHLYQIKQNSADGRLLIWKVTTQAFIKQPYKGVGLGGFAAAYAETQAQYLSSGKATDHEKKIAGSPQYAFNEYLQMALEQGIAGVTLFLFLIGTVGYWGVKNRQIGATGSLLALAVFSFSAYPLQLPSFWVVLVFISVICIGSPKPGIQKARWDKQINLRFVGVLAALFSFLISYLQKDQYDAYKAWGVTKILYNNRAYELAAQKYETIYPMLSHEPTFLFEYAQSVSKSGDPKKANELLNRATQLSADPMIHYMIAKNNQTLGCYLEAEKRLCYAIEILPERIYPYYLLTKLYAEPAFYRPEKRKAAVDSVLTKEPKVHTTAIDQMRKEVAEPPLTTGLLHLAD